MKIRYYPYTLELRDRFTLAAGSRTTTPCMMVELEHAGLVGYGEASMPPYLGETQESAATFLSRIDLTTYQEPFSIEQMVRDIDTIAKGNPAAKAAFDIALHDWVGKKRGEPWYKIWGLDLAKIPPTSFTIGIDEPSVLRKKVRNAAAYKFLKVKLGSAHDRAIITAIREVCDTVIRVDANQGWADRADALRMIEWLAGKNVELVEQPLPRDRIADLAWLHDRSPLPIIGDESVQRLPDIPRSVGLFHGVNIKLMKSAGMLEAHAMMTLARSLGLKVMIGCMTETSCAISAAAQLSPLADWADLDGAALIANDPFDGAKIIEGRVVPRDWPGIGVEPRVKPLGR